MVVLVEVARKAYLASIVPVIVNAILNEHQIIVDIVAFVNRGDFPRSRLGEKQRGKILAGWVSRKMRTMAQFAIRDMAVLDQDASGGGGSSSGAATDANRASLSSMRSGGPGGSGGAQSSVGPPQILEQRELEQQHDEDFMYGGDGAVNRTGSIGGGGGNGLPPPTFGAIEMPADDNVVLTRASTATDSEPYAHGGDNSYGDGHGNGEGGYADHDGGAGASGGMNNYDYDGHEYENENDVLTPTQAHVGMLAVRNADAHADSSSDEDERPPPPIGRKPIPRKSVQSPPPGPPGQAPPPPPPQQQQQQQQHEMFLPGVDGRPSMNDSWRLITAMYSNEGGVVGASNTNTGAGGQPVSMSDDEWARDAMRGLSLADNFDRRQ